MLLRFAPAVSVEPVCLQTAPECSAADAQELGRLGELPVMRVERLDDSLFFPGRQRGWALHSWNEHRLAELEAADPERAQSSAECGQPRTEIGSAFGQVHPRQRLAGLVVGVEDLSLDIEHDDALAEPVEEGLGEW